MQMTMNNNRPALADFVLGTIKPGTVVDVTDISCRLVGDGYARPGKVRRAYRIIAAHALQYLAASGEIEQLGHWSRPAVPEDGGPGFRLPASPRKLDP